MLGPLWHGMILALLWFSCLEPRSRSPGEVEGSSKESCRCMSFCDMYGVTEWVDKREPLFLLINSDYLGILFEMGYVYTE